MIRTLASGTLVEVGGDGRATLLACPWWIEVPSGNPEPDSIADTVKIVECGARMKFDAPDGERCEYGHEFGNMELRYAPGGPEWQREEQERLDCVRGLVR